MSWQVTGAQKFPAVIGEPFGGGFFAGYISHTADGSPTHALIVAPKAAGAASLRWKTTQTTTPNTTSLFDGVINTAAMVTAGIVDHPAAEFCVNLSIGGFTDWYLPSRNELEIAYFNLKPSAGNNNTAFGANPYSVPTRNANYTSSYPPQTYVSAFNTSTEAFSAVRYHSSSEISVTQSWTYYFDDGLQNGGGKALTLSIRAFRRIAL
jgi:hypothetical protein